MVNIEHDIKSSVKKNSSAIQIGAIALAVFFFWKTRKDLSKDYNDNLPRNERRTFTYSASDVRLPSARENSSYYAPQFIDPAKNHRLFH